MDTNVRHKQVRRPRGQQVRQWPRWTTYVPSSLDEDVRAVAKAKGLSITEAVLVAMESVGLPYLKGLAPRIRPGAPDAGTEHAA